MAPVLVERHYAIKGEKNTQNMNSVLTEIPRERYDRMVDLVKVHMGPVVERRLGRVMDATRYYYFTGDNVFLEYGIVQTGIARTVDNEEGFEMTRLFANSLEQVNALERECGLNL